MGQTAMIKQSLLALLCIGMAYGDEIVLPPYVGDGRVFPTVTEVKEVPQTTAPIPGLRAIPYTRRTSTTLPTSTALQRTEIASASTMPNNTDIPANDAITATDIPETAIKLDSIESRLLVGKEFVATVRSRILDQHNLLSDPALFREKKDILQAWMKLYEQDWACKEVCLIPSGVRMIAEVRLPENIDQAKTLYDNLILRRSEGYNAVLLTFAGTESSDYLMALALYLKDMGLSVWFSYGGPEQIKVPVFIEPDRYMDYLLKLSAVCDGFISHWRRTSSHLFIQDQAFMDFTASVIHSVNPSIPILGELFFGPTAMNAKNLDWVLSVPGNQLDGQTPRLVPRKATCAGGYVITNLSTANINVKHVLSNLLHAFRGTNYVIITGPRVYYLTSNVTNTTYEEDRAAIVALEKRWLDAGITGTITLHGDGSEGTDNMSLYKNPKHIKKVQQ